MTFAAGNCQVGKTVQRCCLGLEFSSTWFVTQTTANYVLSQLVVWDVDFPGGITATNVNFRALTWAVSEGILLLVIALNYLPREWTVHQLEVTPSHSSLPCDSTRLLLGLQVFHDSHDRGLFAVHHLASGMFKLS
jgi:hypothetical protein